MFSTHDSLLCNQPSKDPILTDKTKTERAIAQSLAREFGPQGVHVAHAIIDGGIDIPRLADDKSFNNGAKDGKISPDAVSQYAHFSNCWLCFGICELI